MAVQKKRRDFNDRDEWEREDILSEIWCDNCGKGNLGIESPSEYEIKGTVYLEGACLQCSEPVVMRIDEELVRE